MAGEISFKESGYVGAGFTMKRRQIYAGFEVVMFGHGFEASRCLDEDDLREIRDWINRELGDGDA